MNCKICLWLLFLGVVGAYSEDQDPWKPEELISPAKLAAELKTSDPARLVLYIGFPVLYKGAHIVNAKMAGPCSKQEGLDKLAEELKTVPHDAEIVIYCGCCPFVRCPNIRPAYRALKEMGFSKIQVLELTTNLHTDWVEKGYQVERSSEQPGK